MSQIEISKADELFKDFTLSVQWGQRRWSMVVKNFLLQSGPRQGSNFFGPKPGNFFVSTLRRLVKHTPSISF
jgi:hypothetical protein